MAKELTHLRWSCFYSFNQSSKIVKRVYRDPFFKITFLVMFHPILNKYNILYTYTVIKLSHSPGEINTDTFILSINRRVGGTVQFSPSVRPSST